MRVLTVIANPSPKSFCHVVLAWFSKGPADASHTNEVVDPYAIDFDPVFRRDDFVSYVHESMPADILETMNLKQRVLDSAGNIRLPVEGPKDGLRAGIMQQNPLGSLR